VAVSWRERSSLRRSNWPNGSLAMNRDLRRSAQTTRKIEAISTSTVKSQVCPHTLNRIHKTTNRQMSPRLQPLSLCRRSRGFRMLFLP
jgi:hypothetical protein